MIQQQKAAELKRKALEPQDHFCYILKKNVATLVEYPDYKSQQNKGEEGSLYCSNIIPCFHNEVKCMYSGISMLYRDPFVPSAQDLEEMKDELPAEEQAKKELGTSPFQK